MRRMCAICQRMFNTIDTATLVACEDCYQESQPLSAADLYPDLDGDDDDSSESSIETSTSESSSSFESSTPSSGSPPHNYVPPVKPTKPLKRAPKQIPIAELNQKRKFHFDED